MAKRFFINRVTLTLTTTLLVVILFLYSVPFLDLMELKTLDLRFVSRGQLPASGQVVMAMVDEKSLEQEGRWPWPRWKMAALVDALSKDGAAVIGFDIGFLEPDENAHLQALDAVAQQIESLDQNSQQLTEFLSEYRTLSDNDQILAHAMAQSSADIVLGYFFHINQSDINFELTPGDIERQLGRIASSRYGLISRRGGDNAELPMVEAFVPQGNMEIFARTASGSGFFNRLPDPDGVVRWAPLMIRCRDDVYAALSVQTLWHFLGRPMQVVQTAAHGVEGIQLGDLFIPTDEYGRLLINHYGPSGVLPSYPITDIIKGRLPAGTFSDKIVLVGGAAMGIADYVITPFSPATPGLEMHATLIENMLAQNALQKPAWTGIFDLAAIVGLCLLTAVLVSRLDALKGFVLALLLFGGYLFGVRVLFIEFGLWLNLVYPLLGLVLTYLLLTGFSYFIEQRERRRVKAAFNQYVSAEVIDTMLANPDQLKLGGEVKTLSVLFSDLAGFTTYSEKYGPTEMIKILNEYFSQMTEEVFKHQGTLKEYVADELMAIFGAPVYTDQHAKLACNTALAMRERLIRLRSEWTKIGRPPLTARTGVNSGPMLVGNLGSVYRFAYGVLGDQVNLGSRLEGLNKQYGSEILIGENTARLVGDAFVLHEIDAVRVVGKKKAVKVYELVAHAADLLPSAQQDFLGLYTEALTAYRQRNWLRAQDLFVQAGQCWPSDHASGVMAQRCQDYLQQPPPEDWDGVYVATKK